MYFSTILVFLDIKDFAQDCVFQLHAKSYLMKKSLSTIPFNFPLPPPQMKTLPIFRWELKIGLRHELGDKWQRAGATLNVENKQLCGGGLISKSLHK